MFCYTEPLGPSVGEHKLMHSLQQTLLMIYIVMLKNITKQAKRIKNSQNFQ